MKFAFALLILVSYACSAQNGPPVYHFDHVVTYQLKYIPDSTKPEKVLTSRQVLLFNSQQSLAGALNNINADTIIYNYLTNPGLQDHISTKFDDLQFRIIKEGNTMTTFDGFPRVLKIPPVKYQEEKSLFNWQIDADTATIENMFCQKAECDFGGRHWIAWFSASIPVSDGPYEFCGLPGLIVNINDQKNYYNFTFTSIVQKDCTYPMQSVIGGFPNAKLVTKQKYLQNLRADIDNFMGLITSVSGSASDEDRQRFQTWANRAQTFNNWIEPYKREK